MPQYPICDTDCNQRNGRWNDDHPHDDGSWSNTPSHDVDDSQSHDDGDCADMNDADDDHGGCDDSVHGQCGGGDDDDGL